MQLYEEIIFLRHYFAGKWVVENVKPYYAPLVAPAAVLQRHLFWSNFAIPHREYGASNLRTKNKIADFDASHLVAKSKISNKRQVLRNSVDPQLGLYVLQSALLG